MAVGLSGTERLSPRLAYLSAMPVYDRGSATEYEEIDRWADGVGWLAHPGERGLRASHALRGDDGVWLVDPVDAPGVDDLVAEFGEVAGVTVLLDYHARDAGSIATRHDVPVHVPKWCFRVEDRVDAPVERFAGELGDSGYRVHRFAPVPWFQEGIAIREDDGTVYVPESLGTAPFYRVGDEAIGVHDLVRLTPPRGVFEDLPLERLLFGHGPGVFEDVRPTLEATLRGARRRIPAALVSNGLDRMRATWSATIGR